MLALETKDPSAICQKPTGKVVSGGTGLETRSGEAKAGESPHTQVYVLTHKSTEVVLHFYLTTGNALAFMLAYTWCPFIRSERVGG